jgi:phenylpyruvate tautomerase PptA (4-oxalocrotonate tautomerase family)
MPCLQARTNLTLTADQKNAAVLALSKIVSQQTGKPEGYVLVLLEDGVTVSFGGSTEPSVFLDLRSIGCISGPQNKKSSAALTKYFVDTFKVPSDRIYISFQNFSGENWGYNGGTFG